MSHHTPSSWKNAVYEYLPALSRGPGVPQPTPRLELVTVELTPEEALPDKVYHLIATVTVEILNLRATMRVMALSSIDSSRHVALLRGRPNGDVRLVTRRSA